MFNFYEELSVLATLLTLNLLVLLVRGQLSPLRRRLGQAVVVWREALQQMGSNPHLLLFFWLVFAQACGWAGVILTLGWSALVQTQTGSSGP